MNNFFNKKEYKTIKSNDYVLNVQFKNYDCGTPTHYDFDFLARLLTINTGFNGSSQQGIPFSQIDPDVLIVFRNRLIELGGHPPEIAGSLNEKPQNTYETWIAMGESAIAHVGIYPALDKKLTTIFNFESRQQLIISENMKTSAETHLPPVNFDELSDKILEKAMTQFRHQGGVVDENNVLQGRTRLDKKSFGTSP